MKVINNIKYLSQRDAKWSTVKIGNSNTTLGRMGCTITCLSMLSDFFGCYRSPVKIAEDANNFQLDSIIWINLKFKNFSFRWREGHYFSDADNKIDIDLIDAYLAHGKNSDEDRDRAVILEVANRSHWVVGLWRTYDNDILAIDPWTGETCEVFKKYQNITGAAFFQKNTKNAWKGKMKPEAPDYK